MDISLKGKVALITGATSGIGEAAAQALGAQGCSMMLSGRRAERLEALKNELDSSGARCEILAGDANNEDFARMLVESCVQRFGNLDILINSAGIIDSGGIESESLEQFDRIMAINVRSVLYLMQLSIPHLARRKGNILNVSSIAGARAFGGLLSYSVSKAAVDQMTRCAALDLAPKGIRVNAVNPGVVKTELHKRSGMDSHTYARFLEHSKTTHPLGRTGTAGEVADLILFLCSDAAGWITGATYAIDGGRAQTCAR